MEEGFALMKLSKYKRWEASLHRVNVKQQLKENRLILCLHATEKYKKVESMNTQND